MSTSQRPPSSGVAGLVYTNGVDMLWYPSRLYGRVPRPARPRRRAASTQRAYTCPTSPKRGWSPGGPVDGEPARRRDRLALPAAVVPGAGLTLATAAGAPPWVGRTVVAAIVPRRGRRRRDALDHLRPGGPVPGSSSPPSRSRRSSLLWAWARGGSRRPGMPAVAPSPSGPCPSSATAPPARDPCDLLHAAGPVSGDHGPAARPVRFYTNPDGRAAAGRPSP